MKIILSVDNIRPPLTGVGRYALEIAQGLAAQAGVQEIRYITATGWLTRADQQLGAKGPLSNTVPRWSRGTLARFVYPRISGLLDSYRLRGVDDFLYHGTNVLVPQFRGRIVSTIHDLSVLRFPRFHEPKRVAFQTRAIERAVARADALIAVSEFTRREVLHYFPEAAARIFAVPLGVGAEYHPRSAQETAKAIAQWGLVPGEFALCIATIEPRKNIEGLLDAYENLLRVNPKAYPLVICGHRGWNSEHIHRRIEQAQRAGWLRYLGYVSGTDLPQLLAAARVFVYPSRYEGFGLPVLEAMASGVPVITSAVSSLPEVAGGAAILVQADDAQAIAHALGELMASETLHRQFATAGLAIAGKFAWARTVAQTLQVYRKISQ